MSVHQGGPTPALASAPSVGGGPDGDLSATPRHLVATDRLATLGSVVRGLVHELNNPLTTILTNLNYVSESLAELAAAGAGELTPERLREVSEAISDVRDGAERVRGLVRDVHALAADVPRTPLDVERVLGAALRVLSYDLRQRAVLVIGLAGGLPEVEAEEGPLSQLFLALLLNAAQAIPPGNCAGHTIRVGSRVDAAGCAVVEIQDSGLGLPRAVRERLFQPLCTSKPPGVGTGLGLHACHTIAAAMGATLELLDAEGGGTLARLTMPPRRPPPPARQARRGRVLVVDDDPTIGNTVARVLRAHEVVLLSSPRAALARIEAGERFDVVLCDLMMPELTGMELHERIARVRAGRAAGAGLPERGSLHRGCGGLRGARAQHPLREAVRPGRPARLRGRPGGEERVTGTARSTPARRRRGALPAAQRASVQRLVVSARRRQHRAEERQLGGAPGDAGGAAGGQRGRQPGRPALIARARQGEVRREGALLRREAERRQPPSQRRHQRRQRGQVAAQAGPHHARPPARGEASRPAHLQGERRPPGRGGLHRRRHLGHPLLGHPAQELQREVDGLGRRPAQLVAGAPGGRAQLGLQRPQAAAHRGRGLQGHEQPLRAHGPVLAALRARAGALARATLRCATHPSLFTCRARPRASAPGGTSSVRVEPAAT